MGSNDLGRRARRDEHEVWSPRARRSYFHVNVGYMKDATKGRNPVTTRAVTAVRAAVLEGI